MIIDTGSSISLVKKSFLPDDSTIIPLEQPILISGIHPETIPVLGSINLPIFIDNRLFYSLFYVISQSPFNILLGSDNIRQFGFIVDLKSDLLHLDETRSIPLITTSTQLLHQNFAIILQDKRSDLEFIPCHLRVQEIIQIPESMSVIVEVKVDSVPTGPLFTFLEKPKHIHNPGISISYMEINFDFTKIRVIVDNLSERLVTLYPGMRLGTFISLIGNEEISREYCNIITADEKQKAISSKLTDSQKEELDILLEEYQDIFKTKDEICPISKIVLPPLQLKPGAEFKRCKPYKTSEAERQLIDEQVEDLLRQDVIYPSHAQFASPVFLIPGGHKGSTKPRMVINCKALNAALKNDNYPINNIDQLLNQLRNGRYFSLIDLRMGYNQALLPPESQELCSFVTESGVYTYKRLFFGISCGPSLFQRALNDIFRAEINVFLICYLDDIAVYSESFADHCHHLQIVFRRFREFKMSLSGAKCIFGVREMKILGHFISQEGIRMDPDKISAIVNLKRPTDLKQIRAFVGIVSYYRKFIAKFSTIIEPISNLIKGESLLNWGKEHDIAFEKLKTAITSPPVLGFFDPQFPTEIHCDSSDTTLGSVLCQIRESREVVIAYASRMLSKTEIKYSCTEKEFLAICWSCEKFRCYIYLRHCKVVTDHKALSSIRFGGSTCSNRRITRWALALSEYNLTIVYRPGAKHTNADGLSRLPAEEEKINLHLPQDYEPIVKKVFFTQNITQLEGLGSEQEKDPFCNKIKNLILAKHSSAEKYTIMQNIVYHIGRGFPRLLVPPQLRQKILKSFHTGMEGMHRGRDSLYYELNGRYYWPGQKSDVAEFIRTCETCQFSKNPIRQPQGFLKPISFPPVPFFAVSMDAAGPFHRTSQGNVHILTCCCLFTRYIEIKAVPNLLTSTVIKFLTTKIFTSHGHIRYLLTDQGTSFLSKEMKAFLIKFNTIHRVTSGYHPQTNGCIERYNKTIKSILKCVLTEDTEWDYFMPYIKFCINNSYHKTLSCSPFELVYGRKAITSLDFNLPQLNYETRQTQLEKANKIRKMVEARINLENQARKERYDKSRKEESYDIGDLVLVYIPAVKPGEMPKLSKMWKGPYLVLKKLSDLNYNIQRLKDGKVTVVHITRMKPFRISIQDETEEVRDQKDYISEVEMFIHKIKMADERDKTLKQFNEIAAQNNSAAMTEKKLTFITIPIIFPVIKLHDYINDTLYGSIIVFTREKVPLFEFDSPDKNSQYSCELLRKEKQFTVSEIKVTTRRHAQYMTLLIFRNYSLQERGSCHMDIILNMLQYGIYRIDMDTLVFHEPEIQIEDLVVTLQYCYFSNVHHSPFIGIHKSLSDFTTTTQTFLTTHSIALIPNVMLKLMRKQNSEEESLEFATPNYDLTIVPYESDSDSDTMEPQNPQRQIATPPNTPVIQVNRNIPFALERMSLENNRPYVTRAGRVVRRRRRLIDEVQY